MAVDNFFKLNINATESRVIELWKPIEGYEGLYEISNYGEVKSLDKWVDIGMGRKQFLKGKIRPSAVSSNGYRMITLTKNKRPTTYCIHALVATNFISNPLKKPIVNHRNASKIDNYIENLEWATYSENIKHAYKNKLRKASTKGRFGKLHHNSKPVIQFSMDGAFIKEWDSASDAARELNIRSLGITAVCRGEDNSYKRSIWRFKEYGN